MIHIGSMDWDIDISWSDVAPLLAIMIGSMGVGVAIYIKYLKLNRCFVVQLPKE
tara:strand:+ start:1164 stop:1325 length:162 start_codon:yes stop_codon:yes gene_type:complete